ncbi:hypothetical protein [Gracilimonas tropica]|uniref:hypothetical protein n=1 Tax=Gracilimonas tropica TaxID=454600 RepID=UPI000380CDB4|nr:hypothetical protein [Gracilimonas tropica]
MIFISVDGYDPDIFRRLKTGRNDRSIHHPALANSTLNPMQSEPGDGSHCFALAIRRTTSWLFT